jgi:hypothetical protein
VTDGLPARLAALGAQAAKAAGDRRAPLVLAALSCLLALSIRWDFVRFDHPLENYVIADMAIYVDRGRALGRVPRTSWDTFTPVGYPAFLALCDRLAPGDLAFVGRVQAVLGSLTAGGAALLATRIQGGLIAGAFAGMATAVCFPLVLYTGLALSETLCAFLLVVFVLTLSSASPSGPARGVVAGAALAGAIATRPSFVVLLPLLALLALRRFPSHRPMRFALAGAMALLLPLAIHTSLLLGRPALVASNGGVNFYLAHSECGSVRSQTAGGVVEVTSHYNRAHFSEKCVVAGPLTDERPLYAAGLREIAAHPSRVLRAVDAFSEGLGWMKRREWPDQPFWPGSMADDDRVWAWSKAYLPAFLLPALVHAVVVLRKRPTLCSAQKHTMALTWLTLASVFIALFAFCGNPRVRVSSDPLAIALAGAAVAAFSGWLVENLRALTARAGSR